MQKPKSNKDDIPSKVIKWKKFILIERIFSHYILFTILQERQSRSDRNINIVIRVYYFILNRNC